MSERRRGLGRGLGALIPSGPPRGPADRAIGASSPVDVFFPERDGGGAAPGDDDVDGAGPHVEPGEPPTPVDTAAEAAQEGEGVDVPGTGAGSTGAAHGAAEATDSSADDAAASRDIHTDAGGPENTAGAARPVGEQMTGIGVYFAELELDAIAPNPRQPRQVFDPDDLAELVASLREVGLLQPVVVRPVGGRGFELIMGERRWRAAREAGWSSIPAIVRQTDDEDLLRDALLENLHRSQLNPLEEAAAYDQLLRDFGCTHEELAGRLGRSRPQVSNTIRLLRLPPAVQRRVAAGVLSAGHARALLALDDEGAQDRLATRIVAEGLSVRATEEVVALGAEPETAPRRPRSPTPVAPRLQDIAGRLSDHFDTRVKVDLGRRKGRIVVEFASLEDLERIVGQMSGTTGAGEPAG